MSAISVLIVEDSEEDALLEMRELTRAGLKPLYKRVETANDFLNSLAKEKWDIVLCDFALSSFNGLEALHLLRMQSQEIPFIFVSGTQGEDKAVAAMKSGANDYIVKGNLKRLASAVERSLSDAKIKIERKQFENQLIQAQKMESLSQLTAGISHDFNNLMTVIQGNLELMRLFHEDKPKLILHIDQALNATFSAGDLINRLMAFACMQPLIPLLIDFHEVIASIVKLLTPLLGPGITITTNVQKDLWAAKLDRNQLQSALVNMAINSKEAIRGNGELHITCCNYVSLPRQDEEHSILPPGEYIKVIVTDTGRGIHPDHLDHVFEPFFSTKATGDGAGLGLSIVYGFVKQSNGHIHIKSLLNEGTCFTIFFPRDRS